MNEHKALPYIQAAKESLQTLVDHIEQQIVDDEYICWEEKDEMLRTVGVVTACNRVIGNLLCETEEFIEEMKQYEDEESDDSTMPPDDEPLPLGTDIDPFIHDRFENTI